MLALVTILAGTALALSNIIFKIGTVASYDFGGYGPGYPVPGLIQIHGFKMEPGETVPWQYHKGASYVILARGTRSCRSDPPTAAVNSFASST